MSDERIVVTRTFKFEDPEEAFKQARRRITNNALRRQQRSLDLSDYGFAELPSEIGMLSSLTHLDVSGNRLARLPSAIGSLQSLRGLNLSKNTLSLLPIEFWSLVGLKTLQLSNNQIVELPSTLEQMSGLENLDLSSNELSLIPSQIGKLARLQRLYLSENHLSRLPTTVGQLVNLFELYADENEIDELPEEIFQLSSLTSLSFSGNKIRLLPENIGQLQKLSFLDIDSNKIRALPPSIGNLSSLERFHSSNNELTRLPVEVGRLRGLTALYLASNNLEALPVEIGLLQNLRILDLRSNRLRELVKDIGKLENLTRLSLDGNLLEALPEEVRGLTKLRRFTLKNNKVTALPNALGTLPTLELLDLENNSLDQLPKSLGHARSLGRVTPRPPNADPKQKSNLGLYLSRNPLPHPYPNLIAPGQPLATLNVLAWLRDELDTAALPPQNVPSSERKGNPPEPTTEAGPSFKVAQGKFDLAPALELREFDKITQQALLQRLKKQSALLQSANLKVGNQHPLLVRTINEYVLSLSPPLDEIDVVEVWSVGTSVLAQALAFERQDAHRTISEPLEPSHLALLIEVSRLHGGFVLGFPAGLELTARSDATRLAPEVARLIERPTSDILASLSKQRRLFSERARGLADALDAGLLSTSWEAARVGHASYVTVRNLLIETGRTVLAANNLTSTVAGGLAFSAAVQQSGLTLEAAVQLSEFIRTNTAEILSFVAPFPELRAWVEWMINYFDQEEKRDR